MGENALAQTGDNQDLVECHRVSGSNEGAQAILGETGQVTDEATSAASRFPGATTVPVHGNDPETRRLATDTPEIPTNNDGDIRKFAGNSQVDPGNDDIQPSSPQDEEMNGEIIFEDSFVCYAAQRIRPIAMDVLLRHSHGAIMRICGTSCHQPQNLLLGNQSWRRVYLHRKLAIYEEPPVMLLLRRPIDVGEIRRILDLPSGMILRNDNANVKEAFWIVESVIEPKACRLRLSSFTTVSSVDVGGQRRKYKTFFFFELVSPAETIVLCPARAHSGSSFNNETWVETQCWRKPLAQPSSRLTSLGRKARCFNETDPGSTRLSWELFTHTFWLAINPC